MFYYDEGKEHCKYYTDYCEYFNYCEDHYDGIKDSEGNNKHFFKYDTIDSKYEIYNVYDKVEYYDYFYYIKDNINIYVDEEDYHKKHGKTYITNKYNKRNYIVDEEIEIDISDDEEKNN